jgi:hypothetical protein
VVLLTEVPWASRIWAVPFLSALAYSERYTKDQPKRHRQQTGWAWQLLVLVRRWYSEPEMVAVADRAYASQAARRLPTFEKADPSLAACA